MRWRCSMASASSRPASALPLSVSGGSRRPRLSSSSSGWRTPRAASRRASSGCTPACSSAKLTRGGTSRVCRITAAPAPVAATAPTTASAGAAPSAAARPRSATPLRSPHSVSRTARALLRQRQRFGQRAFVQRLPGLGPGRPVVVQRRAAQAFVDARRLGRGGLRNAAAAEPERIHRQQAARLRARRSAGACAAPSAPRFAGGGCAAPPGRCPASRRRCGR